MKIITECCAVICFVAALAAIVFARFSSISRPGVRLASSLLFATALIFFGMAPILAAEAERDLHGHIPIGAGEGAQFGLFAVIGGTIWFGVSLFRLFRRTHNEPNVSL